ncbi:Sapep family Mn(2+)-dependent dipeptidase [Candidatus Allofournierella excrementigallinarum]|uniref:Sapep family Mn(2+)-dependent dipeptidase n=1 Tax=Candidatus Allofournierella excrementigallinarum TaxID=2838592 RepID=UPI00374F5DD3
MLFETYRASVDAFVAANRENVIRDIKRLVDVPSVEGPAEPGKPFGPGPAAALAQGLAIAEEMGLATHNCENYIGWAELAGESGAQIATITHLDVVPQGNGWTADPFDMQVKDGWLIGRGVADDKGPSVLCLYALKFLKEQGVPLKYTVRALLGANEETGMKDVDYYLEHYEAPAFCFSPDAEFPVCNGEKGGFNGELVSGPLAGNLLEFEGGVAHNVIPDRASCLVKGDIAKLAEREGITLEEENGAVRIRGWGRGGHAAMPAGTVNAIGLIVDYLLDNRLCTEEENAFLQVLQKLHHATDGSGVGIAAKDEAFDPLTIIGGMIALRDGKLRQDVDSRYPTSITGEEIARRLSEALGGAGTVENARWNKPFYISADDAAIQALVDTYNEVTGENARPFTMGGGTYARHFPRAVSFGPERLDTVLPDFAGPMHGANEGANIGQLMQALKIYILALLRLQDIEL